MGVSHKASAKHELVKKIIELYVEYEALTEIGKIIDLNFCTVQQILKDNDIYISESFVEYSRKK